MFNIFKLIPKDYALWVKGGGGGAHDGVDDGDHADRDNLM